MGGTVRTLSHVNGLLARTAVRTLSHVKRFTWSDAWQFLVGGRRCRMYVGLGSPPSVASLGDGARTPSVRSSTTSSHACFSSSANASRSLLVCVSRRTCYVTHKGVNRCVRTNSTRLFFGHGMGSRARHTFFALFFRNLSD